MKSMRLTFLLFALTATTLAACNKDKPTTNENTPASISSDQAITVNMTYDRGIDVRVKDIAIVPNNVAPWLGSLFIIDDNNTLWRGPIDGGDFDKVARNISGMAPLARKNAAGILMAHTPGGEIKAFLEINDDSDYRPMPLSKAPDKIDAFCGLDRPNLNHVYARSGQDIIALKMISRQNNRFLEAAKASQLSATSPLCNLTTHKETITPHIAPEAAIDAAILDDDSILFITKESQSAPRLFVQRAGKITAIDITGGITTQGPKRIDAIYVIPNSLGAVLRNGALIMSDNETQRLIYVSLDYLMRQLDDPTP